MAQCMLAPITWVPGAGGWTVWLLLAAGSPVDVVVGGGWMVLSLAVGKLISTGRLSLSELTGGHTDTGSKT